MIPLIPRGYYSRLFQPAAEPLGKHEEEKLVQLGRSMRYEIEREGIHTPRVGYTYFGQFVGHDLTHDITPLDGPYLDPEATPNFRTPFLDLDLLYDGGPSQSPHLYEGEAEAETFKIGKTSGEGYARDVPVSGGHLLIADERNLDNLIVRQLHAVFLKFHNEAVRQLAVPTITGIENLGPGTVFERAQRLVRWHYQWIVRHDFLPRILHPTTWWRRSWMTSRNGSGENSSIPIEFSHAAYRFGHSMVRKAYGLNCRKKRVELPELMALGRQPSPVPDDYVIEWGRFFDGLPASGPVASSAFLDTGLVVPVHHLSPRTIRLNNEGDSNPDPLNLPARTLLRGARAKVPSGQQVAAALLQRGIIEAEDCLTSEQVSSDTSDQSGSTLREVGLANNTPLFYYLLKEAELKALGRTLGPIGSYIVGKVIHQALERDPESYMAMVGRDWELPLWRFPGGQRRKVNSLIGIIRLIGDTTLLPECAKKVRELLAPFVQAKE